MKILQLHSNWVEYEPVKKEIAQAEETTKEKVRVEEVVALFTAVESGDKEEIGIKAIDEIKPFLDNLKVNRILIYPFAHLSSNLARPVEALHVVKAMEKHARELGLDVYRSPFGWTKKLAVDVKGHPLAEQSRVFTAGEEKKDKIYKKDTTAIIYNAKKVGEIHWMTASLVLAKAVKNLYHEVKLGYGMPGADGFYYDSDGKHFSEKDFEKIENECAEIIKKASPIKKEFVTKSEAAKIFENEKFKLESLDEIEGNVSLVRIGDFVDISFSPLLDDTSKVGFIKLLKVGGAFWLGDSRNVMLQRIHGIAFTAKQELDSYLKMREEAEKRDHRKVGRHLDLMSFHEEAPGMVFLHPKGMLIRNLLQEMWRQEHRKADYTEIYTPLILNRELWERSGHWDHYKENMYFTKIDDIDYAVKPMNCPGAIIVYKSNNRSYRELPLRLAEMGLVHRHELSGVLSGLFRVRCFTQDDAHIFIMPEQIKDEIKSIMALIDKFYKTFGLEYHMELSTKPPDAIGTPEMWENAENALKAALEGKKYKLNPGDGAFYGPKIDFHVKDSIGRTWQCATIQVDFAMPERFNLEYVGSDSQMHRPVIIHRVIFGAIERFMGILIEHYAGAFPTWLSPVQVAILPIADRNNDFANKVKQELEKNGIRVEVNQEPHTIEYKIREAQLQKMPCMIIIGDKEEAANTLAVRSREGKVQYGVKLEDFIKKINNEIDEKV